jgi:hypothetical protein
VVTKGEDFFMSNVDRIVFEDKNEEFGFTQLPNVVLTSTVLNPTEVRVYAILRRYASLPKGAMPSVQTICMEANISKATYNRAIKRFVRSTENPSPEIPLVTAIHRPNQSNVYKIHKLSNGLIEKLRPLVAMEANEVKQLKEQSKKAKGKRKGGSQNETSIENTRVSQNETHPRGLKMRPTPSQIETQVILNLSNIDNNNQEQNQNRVVVVVDKVEKALQAKITKQQASKLIALADEHGKDVLVCIDDTVSHLKRTGEVVKSPFGIIQYAITNGWDVTELAATQQRQPAAPAHREFTEDYFDSIFEGIGGNVQ